MGLVTRWQYHIRESWGNRRGCPHFYAAVRKYGKESFRAEVLETCADLEELNKREEYWISTLGTTDRRRGYNIRPGGLNRRQPEETRRKLSEACRGRRSPMEGKRHTAAAKKKLSIFHTGRKASEETRKKMSIARLGRKPALGYRHTEEARRKISRSLLGNKRGCK